MNKSDMWLTILASLGVGAAAYYTMSKSNKPIEQAMQSIAPMLTNSSSNHNSNNTNNNNNSNSGSFGPFGMS